MECQNCKKLIPDNATVCPHCGSYTTLSMNSVQNIQNPPPAKKKSKKKTLIIAIIATIVLIIVAAGIFSDDTENEPVNSGAISTTANAENTTTNKSTDMLINPYLGLTIPESYKALGSADIDSSMSYDISERAMTFLGDNETFFPCTDADLEKLEEIATTVDFREITKSPQKFDNTIIKIDSAMVVDIQEETDETGALTYIHVSDYDGNNYVGYYFGELPGIYEESFVSLYGVPLNVVYFDNISNQTTVATMLAVCYCTSIISEQ